VEDKEDIIADLEQGWARRSLKNALGRQCATPRGRAITRRVQSGERQHDHRHPLMGERQTIGA